MDASAFLSANRRPGFARTLAVNVTVSGSVLVPAPRAGTKTIVWSIDLVPDGAGTLTLLIGGAPVVGPISVAADAQYTFGPLAGEGDAGAVTLEFAGPTQVGGSACYVQG